MTSRAVPTAAELMDGWMRLARRWRHASTRALAPLGLTPGQERALRILTRSDQAIRMGTIAERLGIVPRSATTVIDELEAQGLVRRTVDPANRRSVLVELTDAGRAVQADMAAARADAAEHIFGALTEAQRRQLSGLLDHLEEAATGDVGAAGRPYGTVPRSSA